MKKSPIHFLSGAFALLMASTSAHATPGDTRKLSIPQQSRAAIALAQADLAQGGTAEDLSPAASQTR